MKQQATVPVHRCEKGHNWPLTIFLTDWISPVIALHCWHWRSLLADSAHPAEKAFLGSGKHSVTVRADTKRKAELFLVTWMGELCRLQLSFLGRNYEIQTTQKLVGNMLWPLQVSRPPPNLTSTSSKYRSTQGGWNKQSPFKFFFL